MYPDLVYNNNFNEDNWYCDICLDSELNECSESVEGAAQYEREELVICELCMVVVHPSCYRRDLYKQDPNDDDPWYCERC